MLTEKKYVVIDYQKDSDASKRLIVDSAEWDKIKTNSEYPLMYAELFYLSDQELSERITSTACEVLAECILEFNINLLNTDDNGS